MLQWLAAKKYIEKLYQYVFCMSYLEFKYHENSLFFLCKARLPLLILGIQSTVDMGTYLKQYILRTLFLN